METMRKKFAVEDTVVTQCQAKIKGWKRYRFKLQTCRPEPLFERDTSSSVPDASPELPLYFE